MEDSRAIVLAFNERINVGDLPGLSALMTEDHVFTDKLGKAVRGKPACAQAWHFFFETFPDYRNLFERFSFEAGLVTVAGRSECSDARLNGPALWSAKTDGAQISEWSVHADTPENRGKLGL